MLSKETDKADERKSLLRRMLYLGPQGVMQSAGLIFTVAAAVAFFYGISSLIYKGVSGSLIYKRASDPAGVAIESATALSNNGKIVPFDYWRIVIVPNFDVLAIIAIGVICALLALRLFSMAGSLTSQVIRTEDRDLLVPLIREAKRDSISEYIRLASLSGFSGTFTKLGFTGLPLATVCLSLVLLVAAIFVSDPEMQKSIFDMAKLTLGAFLGSFVQRNIEQEKLVAGARVRTHKMVGMISGL